MNKEAQQLILLLTSNSYPAWEIEAIHKRCCIYYGTERALEMCQTAIDFAREAKISLLESFRLQVEMELSIWQSDS